MPFAHFEFCTALRPYYHERGYEPAGRIYDAMMALRYGLTNRLWSRTHILRLALDANMQHGQACGQGNKARKRRLAAEQAALEAIYGEVGTPTLSEGDIDVLARSHDLPAWQQEVLRKEHERLIREEAEALHRASLRKWAEETVCWLAAEVRSEGRTLKAGRVNFKE